ncbi:hypothetical protein niasHT_017339 [Heterodera trifolii]|uniref:FHA domain-containing protein n=1 Tax=Heterodera trifolii TaxID=157864 RepID=A0ABD2L473_9BILA
MKFDQRAQPNGIQTNPKSTKIVDKTPKKPKSPSSASSSSRYTPSFLRKKKANSAPNTPNKPTKGENKIKSVPNSPQKPRGGRRGGGTMPNTAQNSPYQFGNRTPNIFLAHNSPGNKRPPIIIQSPHRPSSSSTGAAAAAGFVDDDEISHTITFTRDDETKVVTEYGHDRNRDMFQIGRAKNEKIDFTIAEHQRISRYACRIVAERNAPANVYIYAAGFDQENNIFLGNDAARIVKPNGQFDGLVTNGIYILRPHIPEPPQQKDEIENEEIEEFPIEETNFYEKATTSQSSDKSSGFRSRFSTKTKKIIKKPIEAIRKLSPAKIFSPRKKKDKDTSKETVDADQTHTETPSFGWKEVSVTGDIYNMREMRKTGMIGEFQPHLTNKLEDWTLIDVCGATLLWRSAEGLKNSPTKEQMTVQLGLFNNKLRPQDPVYMHTMQFKAYGQESGIWSKSDPTRVPYVYQECGHVQSKHGWKADRKGMYECPFCRVKSEKVIKLTVGNEPAFHMDFQLNSFEYSFNPCGHIASERTVKYWSDIQIPDDHGNFHSICPFCKETLVEANKFIKLFITTDEQEKEAETSAAGGKGKSVVH